MKICQTNGSTDGPVVDCVPATGVPYFIIIITLVLCALLLATIALIIAILVFRHRKKTKGDLSPDSEQVSFSSMTKPLTQAMEIQPDIRNMEPRLEPRQFPAHVGPRKFLQLPLETQRRLITVPEEESGTDEFGEDIRCESPEDLIEHVPAEFDYDGCYEESADSGGSPTLPDAPEFFK